MKIVRLFTVSALVLPLLVGCTPVDSSGEESPSPEMAIPEETSAPSETTWTIPESCAIESIVTAINAAGFPGAVDLTPSWTPAAGTDLAAALDAGGIACGYGIPDTDAGMTVYWVTDAVEVFGTTASTVWVPEGAEAANLDLSVEDITAYFQQTDADADNEYPHWEVNVLFDGGLWVHVATSSWQNPEDGNSIIEEMLQLASD
jgi:hypothetical protein